MKNRFLRAGTFLGGSYLIQGLGDKVTATITVNNEDESKTFHTAASAEEWIHDTIINIVTKRYDVV